MAGPPDPEPVEGYGAIVGVDMATSTRSTGLGNVLGMREPSLVPAWSRPHLAVDNRAVRGRWKPNA